MEQLRYIDLFCGIGGFRLGFEQACKKYNIISECVFSSDINPHCQVAYEHNFGELPEGDITQISENDIPDHDVLLAGFPCQAFSIIGQMKGFEDTRGTLFFDIARILYRKKPKAFILENVKQLVGHNKGKTLRVILKSLEEIGYHVQYKVLNALDCGLPQRRERVIIVGHKEPILFNFPNPQRNYKRLSLVLQANVGEKHYASEYIRNKRKLKHTSSYPLSIWHENKSGNICSYPYSCALRAGASYNYLLVNGERRLTPREMLRLQGFPDTYEVVVPDSQLRRQAGNAVPVNMINAVTLKLVPFLSEPINTNYVLKEYEAEYGNR